MKRYKYPVGSIDRFYEELVETFGKSNVQGTIFFLAWLVVCLVGIAAIY